MPEQADEWQTVSKKGSKAAINSKVQGRKEGKRNGKDSSISITDKESRGCKCCSGGAGGVTLTEIREKAFVKGHLSSSSSSALAVASQDEIRGGVTDEHLIAKINAHVSALQASEYFKFVCATLDNSICSSNSSVTTTGVGNDGVEVNSVVALGVGSYAGSANALLQFALFLCLGTYFQEKINKGSNRRSNHSSNSNDSHTSFDATSVSASASSSSSVQLTCCDPCMTPQDARIAIFYNVSVISNNKGKYRATAVHNIQKSEEKCSGNTESSCCAVDHSPSVVHSEDDHHHCHHHQHNEKECVNTATTSTTTTTTATTTTPDSDTAREDSSPPSSRKRSMTFYFMPHCPYRLYCNLLWENWDILDKMCIFGNSFESYGARRLSSGDPDPTDSIRSIGPFLTECSMWPRKKVKAFLANVRNDRQLNVLTHLENAVCDLRLVIG